MNVAAKAWLRGGAALSAACEKQAVWYASIAFVLALQVALIILHEPWLDEVQALQIAVQSPDLPALLDNLAYEGHPPLWYLVLRGLSAIVGPFNALPAAALIFGLGTQALILLRCPFPRWARVALALSEIILFEYNTISRSFTMGTFFCFAALAAWRTKRLVWLPIALLPMADFLYGVISGILVVLRWRDKALWWPGIGFWLGLSLLAAWSVIPAPDVAPALPPQRSLGTNLLIYFFRLSLTALPFQWFEGPQWNAALPLYLHTVLWLPLLALFYATLRDRPVALLAMFGFIVLQIAFSLTLYSLSVRHIMMVGLLFVLLKWHTHEPGSRFLPAFSLWLALSAICGVATAAISTMMTFHKAEVAAERIRSLGLTDAHWVSFPFPAAQVVSAKTGMKFEYMRQNCMQEFVKWNSHRRYSDYAEIKRALDDKLTQRGRYYILSDYKLIEDARIEMLDWIPAGYDGQDFYLFVVGPGYPEKQNAVPDCVPGLRPLR